MTKVNWSSGYVTYGIPSLAFIGILYTTRVTRSSNLRKERQEIYFKFSEKMINGWRIFEDRSPNDTPNVLKQVKQQFDDWLTSIDKDLSKFSLSSPNYVTDLGDKYYEATVLFYDTTILKKVRVRKIDQKSYNKIYEKFHSAARFDLRHSIWSYLMSILFLFENLFIILFSWGWKLIQWFWTRKSVEWIRSRKLCQWLWTRKSVEWIRSRKFFQWLRLKHLESLERQSADL